jgi:hypothetical protein
MTDKCTLFARCGPTAFLIPRAPLSLYQEAGYQLIKQEEHPSFGQNLVRETWKLAL